MEIPKDELPEWASGGWRSEKMSPEEEVFHRLKYKNNDEWWDDLQTQIAELQIDKLD